MNFYTLKQIADLLATKKISAVEITEEYLRRISKIDPKLNSFITVTTENALKQARLADERRGSGEADVMTGVPIAQKDSFCTKGIKTTCGSKMLANFIAPYDAHIVERCNAAGMVNLGKLNMDEFAMGSSSESSFYGPIKNPWNVDCIPGGSSGGSSAAISAGLTPAATGSDTGGSIRQPASMTGITGLKPTYGRVSRFGLVAYASSLDQAGPMAQTAEDCALFMNVLAGHDTRDSTSVNTPVPNYAAHLTDSIEGLKIGLPREFFDAKGLDPDILKAIHAALKEYERAGATLIEIDLPHSEYSLQSYYVIAPAECSSNLARFDGVRYGYRCENPVDLYDLYTRTRGEGFGPEVKRRIMVGTYVLSSGFYDAYYQKAQQLRRLIANDFIEAFKKVDVIITPTSPEVAFKLGEKTHDPVAMYLSDIYTLPINLAGLPAISIPAGFVKELPVGLQIIGPHFTEAKLLNVAHRYQMMTDWHKKHPDLSALEEGK